MSSIDDSLNRLGTEWVDLYQIHGFDPITPFDETLRTLDDVVRSGKARYVGRSNLAAWQLATANGIAAQNGWSRFESLQAQYTIATRDLERKLVPFLNDSQMGLMIWSPLCGGVLTGKYDRDGKGPDGSHRTSFDDPPFNKDLPRLRAGLSLRVPRRLRARIRHTAPVSSRRPLRPLGETGVVLVYFFVECSCASLLWPWPFSEWSWADVACFFASS